MVMCSWKGILGGWILGRSPASGLWACVDLESWSHRPRALLPERGWDLMQGPHRWSVKTNCKTQEFGRAPLQDACVTALRCSFLTS